MARALLRRDENGEFVDAHADPDGRSVFDVPRETHRLYARRDSTVASRFVPSARLRG